MKIENTPSTKRFAPVREAYAAAVAARVQSLVKSQISDRGQPDVTWEKFHNMLSF